MVRSTSLAPQGEAVPVVIGVTIRELLEASRLCQTTDVEASVSLAQQARVLSRTGAEPACEAEALYRLASLEYLSGRLNEAFAIAVDARDLAGKADAPVVEVWAMNLISMVHFDAGNFAEALTCSLRALDIYRVSEQTGGEGNLLNTVAAIYHSLGDLDRALVTYEAAMTSNKALDRPEFDAVTLHNMAEIRAARSEHLLAASLSEQALGLSRDHSPELVPELLARLAESYCALDLLDLAEGCIAEGRLLVGAPVVPELDIEDGQPRVPPTASPFALAMIQGLIHTRRGHLDAAVDEYSTALGNARQRAANADELRAHAELAAVHKLLGQFEHALRHQEARFECHEQIFSQGADLRFKTLQIAYETETARQQAEIFRLRTGELEGMVRGRTTNLEEHHLEAFQRLAGLAEFRDADVGEHSVRIGDLSAEIATELGEPDPWVQQLRLASRLHDIGKVGVSDAILLKPGPLTPDEFEVIKTHTVVGGDILAGSSSSLIQMASTVAVSHHERWDGTGYPHGLAGFDIPVGGRIVAIADVFGALTRHHSYKRAWSTLDAIRYIHDGSGTQFEGRIVEAFLRVMRRRYPEFAAELSALI